MRLTCPACAAAYEVDAGLIPPGGQHVQCTACHTRWFARRPALAPAAELSEDDVIARLETRSRGPRPVAPAPRAQPALRAVPSTPSQTGRTFQWEEPAEQARNGAGDRPHLRVVERAKLEPAADRSGYAASNNNTDAAADADAAPRVAAAPTAIPVAAERDPAVPALRARPRLDLDVQPEAPPPPPPAPRHGRFGLGLALGLFLVVLSVAGYRHGDAIAEAVPAAAPYAASYVAAIDAGRRWLRSGGTAPAEPGPGASAGG